MDFIISLSDKEVNDQYLGGVLIVTEVSIEVLHSDVEHLKTDVIDIKQVAKEQAVLIAAQSISYARMEIYLAQMQTVQNQIGADAKENARNAELNQVETIALINEVKDAPAKEKKAVSLQVKIGTWLLIISYAFITLAWAVSNILPLLTTLTK